MPSKRSASASRRRRRGARQAWLQLARAELGGGDAAGARSTLEQALLLAPDFAAAKRLLATITAG